ncbi:MDR family MFS transporter [Paenibacillus sp. UNC451MF]|uniref:MDR family MFS transporter n=1 Tax=Paenibacillus sp. UNC451MF TaxID=1449063 RepID=UPI00048E73DC|nr:MFS transporter [Paenibacillus sp. UNC451MF]
MQRLLNFFREYHPIVHVLLFGTVLARTASSMSMPFLAIYLSKDSQLSPVLIGMIIGLGPLASTIGGFVGGAMSDRLGRKTIMLAALIGWVFVFLGFAMVKSPVAFMLLNMLNGLCRSLYEPVSQALMADVTVKEKRLKVFSLRYIAINVGVSVGPLLGAFFGTMEAWLPFMITGFIYLLYAIGLLVLLHRFGITKIEGEKRSGVTLLSAWNIVRRDRVFRYYIGGAIMGAIGYSQMTVTLSQYIEKSVVGGATLFAMLMSLNAIVVVLLQVPLSRMFERWGPMVAIAVGNVMFALGDIGFAFSVGWISFMVSMFFFTLGEILNYPQANVLVDRLAPEGMRGTYFGAQSFNNLGHFIGPLVGGILLTHWGGPGLFVTMAVITLFGTLFYRRGEFIYKLGLKSVEK